MCCLSYEFEFYNRVTKNIPKVGKSIQTQKGTGKVIRNNVLKESVTVILESDEEVDVPYEEIIVAKKASGGDVDKKLNKNK